MLRSGALPAPLQQDLRDQGRPDPGRRLRRQGEVLDVRSAPSAVVLFMLHLLPAGRPHREHRDGARTCCSWWRSWRVRGGADLARHRRPGADHRHGGGRQHHHLRAHPGRVAPGQVARARAVDAGFDRAFWTVFDAHVTNFVAGVVLYSYGSGPIRGFAVTLLVGIITNLFTSVWVVALDVRPHGRPPRRSAGHPVDLGSKRAPWPTQTEVLRDHQARNSNIDFIGQAKFCDRHLGRSAIWRRS